MVLYPRRVSSKILSAVPVFMNKARERLCDAVIEARPEDAASFARAQRAASARLGGPLPDKTEVRKRYDALVRSGRLAPSKAFETVATRSRIRTLSGVAVITVLTKPFPCPGKCVYCPTEAIMPKSYLSNEPAAMRALLNRFDPHRQVTMRLRALEDNGHPTDKIELIVKGGTWSAYEWAYRQWFVKRVFDACNQFSRSGNRREPAARTLGEAQRRNETAKRRIIGLTLETRPDWIDVRETVRLRALGCTRVELGVQSTDDALLELTKRGHDVAATRRAGRLLRDAGFKVDYHMMPQLPGATAEGDYRDMKRLFDDPDFRPDMVKLYPTVVVPQAELHAWWKEGRYVPYPDDELIETLIRVKSELIPPYCRISRLVRDIPSTSIVAGNPVTNLREHLQSVMALRGLRCRCLRCREVGHVPEKKRSRRPVLKDRPYEASGGTERFLSFEDRAGEVAFAFCRLRLPPKTATAETEALMRDMPEIEGAAFVRELHTYGHLVPIDARKSAASQHTGLGRRLMAEAERIAKAAGYRKMAVISGVGVRGYYRKLGYRLQGTYMVKVLK